MTSLSEITAHLIADGVICQGAVLAPVSGGVSCEVWRVAPEQETARFRELSPDGLIVKAPLARLRVPATWEADVSRGSVEAEALRILGAITPGSVPELLWRLPARHAIAMTAAPETWEEWRHQLSTRDESDAALNGARISHICTTLGRTLSTWHVQTQDIASLPALLATGDRLRTLRTDPFHRAAARALPDVASQLHELADELEAARTCMVHGDYSPKNVLVAPDSSCLWVLDAEVAHVGNPGLDVAFLSAHLMLKAVWRPELRARLNAGRLAFEASYGATSQLVSNRTWARQTGAVLAARVCGISRANYLSPENQAWIVSRAKRLVADEIGLDDAWDEVLRS